MKKLTVLIAASGLLFASCGNGETASSTPIDSTNVHGTAPAEYGPNINDSNASPVYEGQYDTGLRANTASREDSLKGRE